MALTCLYTFTGIIVKELMHRFSYHAGHVTNLAQKTQILETISTNYGFPKNVTYRSDHNLRVGYIFAPYVTYWYNGVHEDTSI
jgi:hypothetical protein